MHLPRLWRRLRLLCLVAAVVLAFLAGPAVFAQTQVEMAAAQSRYNSLKASAKPQGDLQREIEAIDKALAEAMRTGKLGEARRLLARGTTRLSGQPWTDVLDYATSITLRADHLFVDSSKPYTVRIEQIYSPSFAATSPLTAHVTLHRPPAPGASGLAARGARVKDFGTLAGVPANLRDAPARFDLKLGNISDGRYLVEVEVVHGDTPISLRGFLIDVTRGLDGRLAKLESGLDRVRPDLVEAFGVDVRYPADFMRKVNEGLIEMGRFDVARELTATESVLRSLERGKDPFAHRTGDFKRHYFFADASEIMPYHLYVPERYDGKKGLPLVIALHGGGGDEDMFFTTTQADAMAALPAIAEQRGYLIVAPLGYRVDGRYGAGTSQDPAVQRKRALSEADVMNVLDLVRRQYRVDDDRVYILGHSMGGAGAWYLGAKFPDRWAALACFAGSGRPETEAQMKNVAQFVVHGDEDATVPVSSSRAMVAEMKRLGIEHKYIEVRGGDHNGVVQPTLEAAFDFFDQHRRKPPV
jgi:poly(3-hydroxybutyrate) depolymerase